MVQNGVALTAMQSIVIGEPKLRHEDFMNFQLISMSIPTFQ